MEEQVVGNEVFVQGKYISLGLNGSGTLGTKQSAPTGIFTDSANGFIRLGMVGDVDGFGTGKAATREAMLTGTPQEGFSVGYELAGNRYVRSNAERTSKVEVNNGATTSVASDAKSASVAWSGSTAEKVKVGQTMTLTEDAKFVRVDVTLTNQTGSTIDNVRYMRTIDPDHGPTFSTTNTVVEQGKDGTDGALIAAYASKGQTPLFFFSADDRAVVSTYGLKNFDPYAAAAYATPQAEGYSNTADEAININFAVGSLAAGATTTVTYYFGITDNLAATVASIKAQETVSTSAPTAPPMPVNAAPGAVNDSASVTGTATLSGNVLANDKDADGDALVATLTKGPANGKLTLAADGSYTYVANRGFVGTDSFTYAASDGKASSSATVSISVAAPPNTAPTAAADTAATTATAAVSGNVLLNDKDADGDTLVATLTKGPANGKLTLAADGSYTYVANKGFVGTDSFTYAASDGRASNGATVTIDVAALPNTGPVAMADAAATVGISAVSGNVLTNDSDADGDALSASVISGPAHGKLVLAADGSFTYVANAGFSGADSFTYAASDGKASAAASVSIKVDPVVVVLPPSELDIAIIDTPLEIDPVVVGTPPSLLTRSMVQNGSHEANQLLTATAGHDTFYFDNSKASGVDTISGFSRGDVIGLKNAIYDGNNDGIITLSKNAVSLQSSAAGSALKLAGVSSLRLMGTDPDGTFVYASGAGRPKGALESKIGDNRLSGDTTDKKTQVFFFDTALDLDLGHDTITNFGKKDVLVTTAALALDGDGHVARGADGSIALASAGGDYDLGAVDVFGTGGAHSVTLEFDGAIVRDGATYYVYSLDGSAVGVSAVSI